MTTTREAIEGGYAPGWDYAKIHPLIGGRTICGVKVRRMAGATGWGREQVLAMLAGEHRDYYICKRCQAKLEKTK